MKFRWEKFITQCKKDTNINLGNKKSKTSVKNTKIIANLDEKNQKLV